ncbi:MAG: hypothetical protein HOI80_02895 [Alphaproteobacteria bacterium]|nr:hypothetical protein [Alphaproteobacteria bacterium]MBT5389571.1 hypothetical protein [Alphaproteobacteria bacterium]MBT5540526.1 hypothetical protein [Alphaproteobacteria bacterium]MBT5654430.1 hypothetical protein [Alphaproteobacteria bacterium]
MKRLFLATLVMVAVCDFACGAPAPHRDEADSSQRRAPASAYQFEPSQDYQEWRRNCRRESFINDSESVQEVCRDVGEFKKWLSICKGDPSNDAPNIGQKCAQLAVWTPFSAHERGTIFNR